MNVAHDGKFYTKQEPASHDIVKKLTACSAWHKNRDGRKQLSLKLLNLGID
jgi:hypothetical protein